MMYSNIGLTCRETLPLRAGGYLGIKIYVQFAHDARIGEENKNKQQETYECISQYIRDINLVEYR